MGDGHTQQARMRNALQGILQRTGCRASLTNPAIEARVIAVANLPVSHHAAVLQQRFHQPLTDGVIVRQIVAIREVEEIRIPALTRVMLLQMRQCQLIGGRTTRATALGKRKKVLFWHLLSLGVMRNEYRVYLLVLELQKAHHPEEETFGDILF